MQYSTGDEEGAVAWTSICSHCTVTLCLTVHIIRKTHKQKINILSTTFQYSVPLVKWIFSVPTKTDSIIAAAKPTDWCNRLGILPVPYEHLFSLMNFTVHNKGQLNFCCTQQ
jgi:hypothetical protein